MVWEKTQTKFLANQIDSSLLISQITGKISKASSPPHQEQPLTSQKRRRKKLTGYYKRKQGWPCVNSNLEYLNLGQYRIVDRLMEVKLLTKHQSLTDKLVRRRKTRNYTLAERSGYLRLLDTPPWNVVAKTTIQDFLLEVYQMDSLSWVVLTQSFTWLSLEMAVSAGVIWRPL